MKIFLSETIVQLQQNPDCNTEHVNRGNNLLQYYRHYNNYIINYNALCLPRGQPMHDCPFTDDGPLHCRSMLSTALKCRGPDFMAIVIFSCLPISLAGL